MSDASITEALKADAAQLLELGFTSCVDSTSGTVCLDFAELRTPSLNPRERTIWCDGWGTTLHLCDTLGCPKRNFGK